MSTPAERLVENADRTATEYLLAVGMDARDIARLSTVEKVEEVAARLREDEALEGYAEAEVGMFEPEDACPDCGWEEGMCNCDFCPNCGALDYDCDCERDLP